ncbi:unnamed protein product [Rotaria magnacalcarata]|uniref:Transposase n=1 Tax=Rotaria magnacalcarata TaxID=392030 RepID=A0A815QE44_9BILA|nr:unnamed protein product [Rotaria magnacalcarata]CAF1462046.1 unnamed protein product [Rotaria magnacalcarata]CAF3863653.1 unnamed protein product [Rotaria magnacalcarata]CAF3867117.1 unnamed protein product [Rotaria magnacalcarata]
MKSKDLQNIVLSKYQNGDTPTKKFRDLNGGIGLRTIKRWCQMILQSGSITLSNPPGCPRLARTKGNIRKVKNGLRRKKKRLHHYKKVVEPLLSDDQKIKRKKFANWIRTHFRKEETMRILFSEEKFFDIDGIYNSQNDRVWAIDRADADKNGGIKQKRKFPQKVMVWLGACSKGVTSLVILDEGTVDHAVYIEKVLPVALKYGNQVFGSGLVFQQDGAKPHLHHLTQQWCRDNFPSFIGKDRWTPNSPDLNPFDYSIWDELVNIFNWNKVQSKITLIQQIKSSFKNIRESIVF